MESTQLLIYLPLIAFAIYRQFATAPVRAGWIALVPLVLIALGLTGLSPLALATPTADLFFALSVAIAVALGLARGLAVEVWTDADGRAWRRGTRLLVALWALSFAVRLALGYVGSRLGVAAAVGLSEVPIFAGLTLGAQNLLVAWRAWGGRAGSRAVAD
jgi:hypothetical protein